MFNSFWLKHNSVSVKLYSEVIFFFVREAGGQFRLTEVSDWKDSDKPRQLIDEGSGSSLPEVIFLESD